MIWIQPPFIPGIDAIDFAEGIIAVLGLPEVAGERIERHAESVPVPVGEDLLDVRADWPPIAAPAAKNGLSAGCCHLVEPQDHAGEMSVVRSGAAERSSTKGASNGPFGRF